MNASMKAVQAGWVLVGLAVVLSCGGTSADLDPGGTSASGTPAGNPLAKQAFAKPDAFSGTFGDGSLSLRLTPAGDDEYTGEIEREGQTFPVKASRSGAGLTGSFATSTGDFPIELAIDGESLKLVSEGTSYSLRRTGADARENPLKAARSTGSKETRSTVQEASTIGLTGSFSGHDSDLGPITVELREQGRNLTGILVGAGERFPIKGTVSGSTASGTAGEDRFEASLVGNELTFTWLFVDEYTGEQVGLPMQLRRGPAGAMPSNASANTAPPAANNTLGGSPCDGKDPAVAGQYVNSEVLGDSSGQIGFAQSLTVRPDGTFVMGSSEAGGGASDWTYTGEGGGGEQGQWCTKGDIVYTRSPGGQWERYARYLASDEWLVFYFEGEDRERWDRR